MNYRLYSIRLWVRDVLPWRTKAALRDEIRRLEDEKQGLHSGLSITMTRMGVKRAALAKENGKVRQEAAEERSARVKIEGDRIAEHSAVRGLMFHLSNGLGTTLKAVDDFIVQLPDYTPDQAEREQVMQGLVRKETP
jgi:hypothetical protein